MFTELMLIGNGMIRKIQKITLFIMFLGLLVGCKSNPVLKLSPVEFNKLIRLSEYRSTATNCANYYIRKERLKITRLSMVCAEFTRDLKKIAESRGVVEPTKLENYRSEAVWKRWRELKKKRKLKSHQNK